MELRRLNESYPDVPRGWETKSFDDSDVLDGDEHGIFYHEDNNILVEVYYHLDRRLVEIRVYAGDTVANGDLITEFRYDFSIQPDYYAILLNVERCSEDIYNKFYDYGIGVIYQVLDRTCSIRDDIGDMINKNLRKIVRYDYKKSK